MPTFDIIRPCDPERIGLFQYEVATIKVYRLLPISLHFRLTPNAK